MVLNQGISGLKILPTLVDSLPNEAVPLSVEVNQDIYYFVEVGNGTDYFDYLPCCLFKSENNDERKLILPFEIISVYL